ncbi:TonB-dependent receptor [Fibrella sp. HMF5335]|uniref:TonB-dependent receptor n=1 Tax=Fibrella rubiginis TaxID=2817060 RepID=A0A939K2Y0_9BACT|nr:TonB-dependent receptor [Fibrella rubiginis]MBO0936789.1 TonB-dependent receptor [Fibrella rubiginis]
MKHLYLLCLLPLFALAQTAPRATLTGAITNAADGQPLPFASVYLNGSTRGTTTDEKGHFSLPDVPLGSIELVVSYTGFTTVRQPMRLTDARPRPVAIALSPLANQLTDVVVRAQKDKTWLRQVRQFERELFGTGNFAGSCVLVNPDVLSFTESGRVLMADARAPLVIDNQALGYRMRYTLQGFRSQPERVTFGGTTLFEELEPATPKQARQWQRNRQEAYKGSLRHLLASLAMGTYEQEGFLVYQTDPTKPLMTVPPPLLGSEVGRHLKPFNPAEMLMAGTLPHERWLRSASPFTVFYTKYPSRDSPYRDAPYAYSQLVLPRNMLGFTVTGEITAPLGFDAVGYLSNDRLGNALPDDWQHDAPPPAMRRDSVQRKAIDAQTLTGYLFGKDSALDTLVQRWKRQPVGQAPAVYLHIDKPLYLTGDRLWLSAYLLNPQTQQIDTALVGPALNVELWSSANVLVQHQFLPVTDGRAEGVFQLSDTLATSTYWLRAYTEADRQRKNPAFERPVWLVNNLLNYSIQTPDRESIDSRDGQAKAVGRFSDDAPDAPFRATVTADSSQALLTLDTPVSSRNRAVFALVDSRGRLIQSARVGVAGAATTVRMSTLTWPSGIARLSLLDSTGRVWATRAIRVPDRALPLSVSAHLDKPETAIAAVRPLSLTLLDGSGRPVNAHVSASVTDADKVPADSLVASFSTYMSMLGGSSDPLSSAKNTPNITLHGQVTTPEKLPVNVVVMAADGQEMVVRAALTDLAGRFQIDNLTLADTAQVLVRVTNSRGKPIDARVSFNPAATRFGPVPGWAGASQLLNRWKSLIDAAKQRQDAEPALYRNNGGRQLREVVIRAPKPLDQRPDDIKLRSLHNQVDQTIVLDDKTPVYDNLYTLIQAKVPNVRVETVLDKGRVAYSVKFSGNVTSVMNAAIAPLTSRGAPPPPPIPSANSTMQNPLFLIDGFPVNDADGTQLLMFSPGNIERVEVLKTGAISAMYGTQASRGVIAFYTKTTRDAVKAKGISRQAVLGYPAVVSYPKLDNVPGSQPDVLAWVPSATTSQQGKLSIPIAVPPTLRVLRVTIQGITDTGQPISCVRTVVVSAK